jgi:hypothetical protein
VNGINADSEQTETRSAVLTDVDSGQVRAVATPVELCAGGRGAISTGGRVAIHRQPCETALGLFAHSSAGRTETTNRRRRRPRRARSVAHSGNGVERTPPVTAGDLPTEKLMTADGAGAGDTTAGGNVAMQGATRAVVDESAAVQRVQTRAQHAQAEASTSHVTDAKATTDSPCNPAGASSAAGGLQSTDRRPKRHAAALHSSLALAKDWTVEFLAAAQDEAFAQLKNGCKIR